MDVETIIMIKSKKKIDLDFLKKVYSNVHSFKICLATLGNLGKRKSEDFESGILSN